MTARNLARTRRAAIGMIGLGLAAVSTLTIAGCDPRALAYFLQSGPEIPGAAPSMVGKKIIVVTTSAPSEYSNLASIDKEMNAEVTRLLRDKIDKIKIVPSDQVAVWVQAHPTWSDAGELAKAFEADMVVNLEIENFVIESPKSPQLLEGNSEVLIKVTEWDHPKDAKGKRDKSQPKEAIEVYHEATTSLFPKNAPATIDQGVTKAVFKSKFLKLSALEVSWHFTGHNNGDDIQDTNFLKK